MTGHEFKPYTDAPDYCVAELPSGDTCNRPRDEHKREQWQPGELAWFEYHCNESPDSPDAPAWYRSHQRVTVLALSEDDGSGMTRAERAEAGQPFTYTVRFPDGLEWCVFEDELSESTAHWYRPDPPRASQ